MSAAIRLPAKSETKSEPAERTEARADVDGAEQGGRGQA